MTDKDLTERDAIKNSLLPLKVNLIMCAYHTLRTFNREITTEKRKITPTERDEAKKILQELVYAETEENYDKLYEKLNTLPQSIVDYFDTNWHESRKEWSLSSDYTQHNFLNGTNNHLESLNAKIKKDLDRYMSLEEFVKQILIFMECSHKERDHKAAVSYQKSRVLPYDSSSAEYRYAELLTDNDNAFKFIRNEFEEMPSIELEFNENLKVYEYQKTPSIKISSMNSSCDCTTRASMILPCRDDDNRNDISDNDENNISDNDEEDIFDNDENDFGDNDDNSNVFDDDIDGINDPDDNRDDNDKSSDDDEFLKPATKKYRTSNFILDDSSDEDIMLPSCSTSNLKRNNIDQYSLREDIQKNIPTDLVVTKNKSLETNSFQTIDSMSTSSEKRNKSDINILSNVIVKPALRRRGRPRGTDKKSTEQKIKIMLKWIVQDVDISKVVKSKILIEESDIKMNKENTTFAIIDDTIKIELIKPYFKKEAWKKLKKVIEEKKIDEWECRKCKLNLNKTLEEIHNKKQNKKKISIGCDYCLEWFHLKCAGLIKMPKSKLWMCDYCKLTSD
ncbi:protein PFC0760c-like [Microplitis mediator]|uniref:protein PFC0760c-like n=1 Tax=Microplitis mediator TaxID=375433 RepID=UPI0025554A63|nr:protein PFC0760c-like [Microplitis mediator]